MLPAAPASSPSAQAPPRSFPRPLGSGLGTEHLQTPGRGTGALPARGSGGTSRGAPGMGPGVQGCGGVPLGCQIPGWSRRGGGEGLTLGMASSSRNLALLRRAARRFCCWSCRGSRLQSKEGVRLPGRPRGAQARGAAGGCPGKFGHSPVFMDIFAFSPLLQLAGAALAHAGGFLWQHLAGGVRWDADPQAKDAFLLFYFFPTQKPGWQRGGNSP